LNKKHTTCSEPQVGRFSRSAVAAAVMTLAASGSWALGLGRMSVQSALGEPLRAEIDINSLTPEEASSLRVRIAPPESYRAAGVDYSAILTSTKVTLKQRSDGRSVLHVTSDRVVQEPFVDVILELSWASGRLVREYTMLLDPPGSHTAAVAPPATPAPAPVAPVIAAAPIPPSPAPSPRVAAPRVAAPRVAAPTPAPRRAAAPTPAPAPVAPKPAAAAAGAGDEYRVRPGDTLYRVATRTQHEGVSLDQMLVALFRSNPQAFTGDNMNRLRAGAVLTVPPESEAKDVPAGEARQLIQAQSADFSAYRQRLAHGAPAVKPDEPASVATGKVQAQVNDKKLPAAASPDRLTLSQGGVKGGGGVEAKLSKDAEQKAQAERMAELSRNVEDLKKLKDGSGVVLPKPGMAPAQPEASTAVTAPAVVAAASVAAAVAAASAPGPAAAVASKPEAASKPAAAKPRVAAKAPAAGASEPDLVASLLDTPFVLPGALVVLALLAGLGVYRWRSRARSESGETSFLESRLQPDSFFGASGGQRIDTRDASGTSSSMSYSLSQLDAIGDVDPVAEADVYLAYGRDLQAEEILKEAMRGNPDRLAIRTKLLEVYAKRRDTKGYEMLASQLYSLTKGEGDEWHKAQELGQQIDPENPMYVPGGQPSASLAGGAAVVVEPLGASTMPQSVMPPSSGLDLGEADDEPAAVAEAPVDLDLDLDLATLDMPPESAIEITQPIEPVAKVDAPAVSAVGAGLGNKLPTGDAGAASTTMAAAFDFGAISLDLGTPASKESTEPALDYSSVRGGFDSSSAAAVDTSDPLVRKLELAEEFRQIGDMEGARDLLEEVVAQASEPLKSRAQSKLDSLA
jgi:pilus assembly protein FimV